MKRVKCETKFVVLFRNQDRLARGPGDALYPRRCGPVANQEGAGTETRQQNQIRQVPRVFSAHAERIETGESVGRPSRYFRGKTRVYA